MKAGQWDLVAGNAPAQKYFSTRRENEAKASVDLEVEYLESWEVKKTRNCDDDHDYAFTNIYYPEANDRDDKPQYASKKGMWRIHDN